MSAPVPSPHNQPSDALIGGSSGGNNIVRPSLSKAQALDGSSQTAETSVSFMQIATLARNAVAFFTELPIDSVVSCQKINDGWIVVVDVIEAKARLDDNDLLASFEVELDAIGTLGRVSRLRRYNREAVAENRV